MPEHREDPQPRPSVEELAEEAAEENPDPITRRETYELSLMEEGRSDEGRDIEVDDIDPDES
jgi:hypothetical protein